MKSVQQYLRTNDGVSLRLRPDRIHRCRVVYGLGMRCDFAGSVTLARSTEPCFFTFTRFWLANPGSEHTTSNRTIAFFKNSLHGSANTQVRRPSLVGHRFAANCVRC